MEGNPEYRLVSSLPVQRISKCTETSRPRFAKCSWSSAEHFPKGMVSSSRPSHPKGGTLQISTPTSFWAPQTRRQSGPKASFGPTHRNGKDAAKQPTCARSCRGGLSGPRRRPIGLQARLVRICSVHGCSKASPILDC